MKAVQIINPSEMKVVELEKPVAGTGQVCWFLWFRLEHIPGQKSDGEITCDTGTRSRSSH